MIPLYQRLREERPARQRTLTALGKALTPAQRAPFDEHLVELGDLSPARRASLRESFIIHLEVDGPDSGPDWVAQQRAILAAMADAAARVEQEQAERARVKAERIQERRQAILAAIARGEPVPAKYRPIGNKCAKCRRALRDPESVRLGIGPECRKNLTDPTND